MKNIFLLSALLFSFSLFYSCDKVEHPIPEKKGGLDWSLFPGGDSTNYTWPSWTPNTNTLQNVLIEDYTGHTCTNCPAAAVVARTLENDNPGRVFVASIHASIGNSFQSLVPPEFTTDFTTEEGNTYVNEIPNFFANPSGTINRKQGGLGGTHWYLSTTWASATNSALTETPKANLQVQYNYFPQTRGLFVHTESEFLTNLQDEYALVIYVVRDVVIAAQKLADGSTEEHYHHHNVFTKTINGAWGTTIASSPVSGDKIYNNFAIQLPDNTNDSTYNIDNLSLITYVYNKNTLEVSQVIGTELQE